MDFSNTSQDHEKFLRDVLRAIGVIIHGEGDVQHVESTLI